MAEIIKPIALKDMNLPDGESTLNVSALSTGLDESPVSVPVTYTTELLDYEQNGTYQTVTGIKEAYRGSLTTLTIPDYYRGYPVKEIASEAFAGNTVLKKATIPNTVKEIGSSAFKNCSALTNVTIDNGDDIRLYFRNNLGWSNLRCTRYFKTGNQEVAYDGGVTMRCVTNDGEADIYTITVGSNISSLYLSGIDGEANVFTYSLTKTEFVNTGCYEVSDDLKIYRCAYVNPPEAAPLILGIGVFEGCTALSSIALPHSINTIPDNTFKGCTELANVTYPPEINLISIGASAFHSTIIDTINNLPASVVEIGNSAFYGCEFISGIIKLPLGLKTIGEQAFAGCTYITGASIDIATPLVSIGKSAFDGCTRMTFINLPETLNFIGENAFNGVTLVNANFNDPYGWFRMEDGGDSSAIYYSKLIGGQTAATSLNAYRNEWRKIDIMPAPTIEIDAEKLTIIDSTGIAETFRIFVNGTHKITVDANTGNLTFV